MSDDDRMHALAIGARLRRVRHQQGLSLADVQANSDGRWKAVVVGAYERGDRTVTLARLADLAEFYDVPLADLLPDQATGARTAPGRVTLDLVRLDAAPARAELAILARYASRVARKRGDHNGRMLTLRAGDL
jgi:transcriptional regulator with XRE-family HTH domain